jgi:hypothetical protein
MFQAVFRQAWEARLLLTIADAAFTHLLRAVSKLQQQSFKSTFKPRVFRNAHDPIFNAGVSILRSAPPSAWEGGGDSFP